jgi:hypothetical protein
MNFLREAAGLEAGKWNEDGLPILVVVLAKPADDRQRMRLTLCPLSIHSEQCGRQLNSCACAISTT